MIVEILPTGGVRVRALPRELRNLQDYIDLALVHGSSRAPYVTDDGVAQFVVMNDAPAEIAARAYRKVSA